MYIAELEHRYGITRKPLYDRLKALGIKLEKDGTRSYATEDQIELLDQQDKHLKNGGTYKNFVPEAKVTIDNTPTQLSTQHSLTNGVSSIVETTQHNSGLTTQLSTQSEDMAILLGDMAEKMAVAIADKMTPPNPLWYLAELERARVSGWELTTSQVKELIGVKPSCKEGKKTFRRGSFIFVKSGKIGNQTSWKVQKVTD